MIYYVSRLRLVSGCARDFAASSASPPRPVARLRTAQVVTESTRDLIALACELKTSTASKRRGMQRFAQSTIPHLGIRISDFSLSPFFPSPFPLLPARTSAMALGEKVFASLESLRCAPKDVRDGTQENGYKDGQRDPQRRFGAEPAKLPRPDVRVANCFVDQPNNERAPTDKGQRCCAF